MDLHEYKAKLHETLKEITDGPINARTVEQATAIVELLHALEKLGGHRDAPKHTEDNHMTREDALRWMARMKNADGTVGPHWTADQTAVLISASGIGPDVPSWAWCVAMNMMYSDYYSTALEYGVNRPEFYASLAKAFLLDKDAAGPMEKLSAYFECVVSQAER